MWVAKWGFTPSNHDNTPNHHQNTKTRKQKPCAKEKHKNRRKRRQTLLTDPLYLTKQQEFYGDNPYAPLPPTHYHLIGGNINGIPVKRSNDKNRILFDFMKQTQSSSVMISEPNLDPRKFRQGQGWYERLKDHHMRDIKTSWAHNRRQKPTDLIQPGGTMAITQGEMTAHRPTSCANPTGLGRWTSLAIKGPSNHTFRIVSAYFPCDNATGETTVYTQHKEYLREVNRTTDPRKAMMEDFGKTLLLWSERGGKIIVFADSNDDIRTGAVNDMFLQYSLKEHITRRHGNRRPLPSTHIRNTSCKPIDGIWSNINDSEFKCGYYPFGEGIPGDHRTTWIRIPKKIVYGRNPPHIYRMHITDLPTSDPRITKKYNSNIKKDMKARKIQPKIKLLRELIYNATNTDKPSYGEITELYEELATFRQVTGIRALKRLRHKHTGAIPHSPEMTRLFDHKCLWYRVLMKRKNPQMGSKQIRRLMKKFNNTDAFDIPEKEVINRLRAAARAVGEGKRIGRKLREDHLEKLANSLAATKNTTAKTQIKCMRSKEKITQMWNRIRVTRKSKQRQKILVTEYTVEGVKTICRNKTSTELAYVKEYESRVTKCLQSPFLQPPLLPLIGITAQLPAVQEIFKGTLHIPEGTNVYAEKLIKQLIKERIPTNKPGPSTKITANEHRLAWKKQKPNTTSEPTTLGFPHYISGAHDPEVSELDALIRSVPYETGIIPSTFLPITDFH
jgi:hypothetical protein